MAEVTSEWKNKIDEINPSLSAMDKELLKLSEAFAKLRDKAAKEKWSDLPMFDKFQSDLDAGLLKGAEEIYKKYADKEKKAINDLMSDIEMARKEGINKDLALTDKWMVETAEKFQASWDTVLKIVEEAERRKLEFGAKYAKDNIQKEIDGLKGWRDAAVRAYDDAIAKSKEYYAQAAKIDDIITHGRQFLAGLDAKPMSLEEQMTADKKALEAMVAQAKELGNVDGLQKALSGIEAFSSKYKGNQDFHFFDYEFQGLKGSYEDILGTLSSMKDEAQKAGQTWSTFADTQLKAIQVVDNKMLELQGRIVEFDSLLAEVRTVNLSTSDAEAKIARLQEMIKATQTPGPVLPSISWGNNTFGSFSTSHLPDVSTSSNDTAAANPNIYSYQGGDATVYTNTTPDTSTFEAPSLKPKAGAQAKAPAAPAQATTVHTDKSVQIGTVVLQFPNVKKMSDQDMDNIARDLVPKLKEYAGRA